MSLFAYTPLAGDIVETPIVLADDRPTFAIGDIHGAAAALQAILAQIAGEANGEPCRVIALGDLIDRGERSREVVETLMEGRDHVPSAEFYTLRGNHEEALLHVADGEGRLAPRWLEESIGAGAGHATLRSYGIAWTGDCAAFRRAMPKAHLAFLRAMPYATDDGTRFFCHAGIDPGRSLDRQRRRDLLEMKEPFSSSALDHGRLVVHGHVAARCVVERSNRICLDTGAGYGLKLTCAVFLPSRRSFVKLLETPSRLRFTWVDDADPALFR